MSLKLFTLIFITFPPFSSSLFKVYLDKFELIQSNSSFIDLRNVTVKKFNNKTMKGIFGEVELMVAFGNEIQTETFSYKKQSGEYRQMLYHIALTPLCKYLIEDREKEIS